jgi:hypothetical protein
MVPSGKLACLGVLAAAFYAGAAAAQHSSEAAAHPSAAGPATTIILPVRIVVGEQATLAVLDAAGRLTPGTVVEFTGGERATTDATGRAAFSAPAEPGVLLARLPGRGVSASTTVVAAQPNPPDGVQVVEYPRVISVSDRFSVEGSGFRGDADSNRALLGDQPALVLAASPVALVLLPGPRAAEGPAQLLIEVGGRSPWPVPVTLVSLEVTATKKQFAPGEKGKLTVRVHGTERRLVIEARNLSPEVVELPRGNVQRVTSIGGAANAAEIEMQGVRAGDFALSVRLVPGAYGLPDMEAARQHLIAARQLATGDWQARLDRVIHRIEHSPQEISRIRDELEKLLAQKPEGELGREIEAAWRELLKR